MEEAADIGNKATFQSCSNHDPTIHLFSMIESLSLSQARSAAIVSSRIGQTRSTGKADTLAAVRRLGSVQIDTISVVERAHHHILWTRNPKYSSNHIASLEAEPRRIIEYWSHAAAYLPIEDYRYCIPRMERIRAQGHEWFRAESDAIAYVRNRILSEGPMRAQDFEGTRGKKGWWDWKPAKRALEYLFHAGELIVVSRRGFQKVYDLAERALPTDLDMRRPSDSEMAAYYLDLAISALGVFSAEEVAYMRKDGIEGIQAELAARVDAGRLLEIDIIGATTAMRAHSRPTPARRYYAEPSLLERAKKGPAPREPAAFVLSPFDPLIIDRKRTKKLFDYAYQLECYQPIRKREFGYFAMPLLYVGSDGEATIVGLLDAKAERKSHVLIARRLSVDSPRSGNRGLPRVDFARVVAAALVDFAVFNKAVSIELESFESKDGRLERSFRAALARLIPEKP
jgi:uncharacterized protein